ncbi:tetratricopeptide repeat protein [Anaeramoeba flamelloides]|uniref:Tetratricopeptide repeat protein n=1 Tax=Anaeramoeba flamelloides TaxID=1746091 RepID=A0AAV7YDF7_9EUKA|nr:tetratricopeptide repeat protein [Anaeramoeba flamelloides]
MERNKNEIDDQMEEAQRLYQKGQYTQAIKSLLKIGKECLGFDASFLLSKSYFHIQEYDKALKEIDQAIIKQSEKGFVGDENFKGKLHYYRSKIMYGQDPTNYHEIKNEFRLAIEKNPKCSKYRYHYGTIYFEEAKTYLKSEHLTVETKELNKRLCIRLELYNLGNKLNRRDVTFLEALNQFSIALNIDSNNSNNFLMIGKCLLKVNCYQKAKDSFEKSHQLNYQNRSAVLSLAKTYSILKSYRKSIICYQSINYLDRNNFLAYYKKGLQFLQLRTKRTNKKAVLAFKKSLQIIYKLPNFLSCLKKYKYEKAVNVAKNCYKGITKALNRNKEHEYIGYYLNNGYYLISESYLGQPNLQAVNWIKRKLARAYSKCNRNAYASSILSKANVECNGNDWKILKRLSTCYRKSNQYKNALNTITKASKITVNNKERRLINYQFAKIYQFKGKYEKALLYYEESLQNDFRVNFKQKQKPNTKRKPKSKSKLKQGIRDSYSTDDSYDESDYSNDTNNRNDDQNNNENIKIKKKIKIFYNKIFLEFYLNQYKKVKSDWKIISQINKIHKVNVYYQKIHIIMNQIQKNKKKIKYTQRSLTKYEKNTKNCNKNGWKKFIVCENKESKKKKRFNHILKNSIYINKKDELVCLQLKAQQINLRKFTFPKFNDKYRYISYESEIKKIKNTPKSLFNNYYLIIKCIEYKNIIFVFQKSLKYTLLIYQLNLKKKKWSNKIIRCNENDKFIDSLNFTDIILIEEKGKFLCLTEYGKIYFYFPFRNRFKTIVTDIVMPSNYGQTCYYKNHLMWYSKNNSIYKYSKYAIKKIPIQSLDDKLLYPQLELKKCTNFKIICLKNSLFLIDPPFSIWEYELNTLNWVHHISPPGIKFDSDVITICHNTFLSISNSNKMSFWKLRGINPFLSQPLKTLVEGTVDTPFRIKYIIVDRNMKHYFLTHKNSFNLLFFKEYSSTKNEKRAGKKINLKKKKIVKFKILPNKKKYLEIKLTFIKTGLYSLQIEIDKIKIQNKCIIQIV